MTKAAPTKFPNDVISELGAYVYRLIDPRTGLTFYVGKGRGNRVFDHVSEALKFKGDEDDEDEESAKVKTIRQIKNEGLEPIHVIHRHGLDRHKPDRHKLDRHGRDDDDKTALQVEAALIDAFGLEMLANMQGGHHSDDYGPANVVELINRYALEVMEISDGHKIIAINVKRSSEDRQIYDAVRFAWRVSRERAEKADYVFAVKGGVCLNVFVPERWLDATRQNFPGLASEDRPGRLGFEGKEADKEILERYRNKRLSSSLQAKKGAQNPIRYNYE